MVQHGSRPYLECSSQGDCRFSAFYARVRGRDGKSIEEIFQAAKVLKDGSTNNTIKRAKGKPAVNHAEVAQLYSTLWDEYIAENPHLLAVLQEASGLQDVFGQEGHCCQATELWRIRMSAGSRRSDFAPTRCG